MNQVAQDAHGTTEGFSIREHLLQLVRARWLIAGVCAVFLIAGYGYAKLTEPRYSVQGLLQLESQDPAREALVEERQRFVTDKNPASSELEVLQSRLLLGEVVDALHLQHQVRPARLGAWGDAYARGWSGAGVAPAPWGLDQSPWGLGQYAWGGERIDVGVFEVPQDWLGESLTLIAGEADTYTLQDPDQTEIGTGTRGQELTIPIDPRGQVRLRVDELRARPGTRFGLVRQGREAAITQLQQDLTVEEPTRLSGVLRIAYSGTWPERAAAAINQLMRAYLQQHSMRKSQGAEATLEFLQAQLPAVRSRLQDAEAALNTFRAEHGSLDFEEENKALLSRLGVIDNELTDLAQREAEALSRYTHEHPAVRAMGDQASALRRERAALQSKATQLPAVEQQMIRLQRDVDVSVDLYQSLTLMAQEQAVAQAGTQGDARILDQAVVSGDPQWPDTLVIVVLAGAAGLFIAAFAALLRHTFVERVEDPARAEHRFGLPVLASIPHSRVQARAMRRKRKSDVILVRQEPGDPAVESLRQLRAALTFIQRRGMTLICGPTPGSGKSFIALNLAVTCAQSGQRVLLVDADLRRGALHEIMGVARAPGLTELVQGAACSVRSVRPTEGLPLDFIPTGTLSGASSELIEHAGFTEGMDLIKQSYDRVIIDSPPILTSADAALLGRFCDSVLLVVRSGDHRWTELAESINRLERAGAKATGLIMNDVHRARGYYGYAGDHSRAGTA